MNQLIWLKKTIIVIALLIFLLYSGYWIFKYTTQKNGVERIESTKIVKEGNDFIFPDLLLGMTKTQFIEGDLALQQIYQLHRKELPLKNGYILKYMSQDQQFAVKIWISESKKESEAKNLLDDMVIKMDNNQMFSSPKKITIDNNITIYRTGSGDTMDFFYQSGSLLVWAQTDKNYPNYHLMEKEITQKIKG